MTDPRYIVGDLDIIYYLIIVSDITTKNISCRIFC